MTTNSIDDMKAVLNMGGAPAPTEPPPAEPAPAEPPPPEPPENSLPAPVAASEDVKTVIDAQEPPKPAAEPPAAPEPTPRAATPEAAASIPAGAEPATPSADPRDAMIQQLLKRIEMLETPAQVATPKPQENQAGATQQATQQQAQVATPAATTQEPVQLFTEDEWDAAIGDHKAANTLMLKALEMQANRFLRMIPQITNPVIQQQVEVTGVIQKFLDTNEDFAEPAKLRMVNVLATDISAQHPDWHPRQVFKEVEKQMRSVYPKANGAEPETPAPPARTAPVDRRANFARAGGGARSGAPETKKNSLADDIRAVINA